MIIYRQQRDCNVSINFDLQTWNFKIILRSKLFPSVPLKNTNHLKEIISIAAKQLIIFKELNLLPSLKWLMNSIPMNLLQFHISCIIKQHSPSLKINAIIYKTKFPSLNQFIVWFIIQNSNNNILPHDVMWEEIVSMKISGVVLRQSQIIKNNGKFVI